MSEPKNKKPSSLQEGKRLLYLTALGLILSPIVIVWIIFVFIDPEYVLTTYYQTRYRVRGFPHLLYRQAIQKIGDFPHWALQQAKNIHASTWFQPEPTAFRYMANSPTEIQFTWDYPTNRHNLSVEIKRAEADGWFFKRIAKINYSQAFFTDTNLKPRTWYRYRLRVCKFLRCSETIEVSIATFDLASASPSELRATLISDHQVELNWKDNSDNELGFLIERSLYVIDPHSGDTVGPTLRVSIAGKEFQSEPVPDEERRRIKEQSRALAKKYLTEVARVGPGQTSFSECWLWPGTEYNYRVKAYSQHYQSAGSPVASVITPYLKRTGTFKWAPSVAGSEGASQVWNGKEWAVAWATSKDNTEQESEYILDTEIHFQQFNETGSPLSEEHRITNVPGLSVNPALAWNGEEYGLVWADSKNSRTRNCQDSDYCSPNEDLFFTGISSAGKAMVPEVRLSKTLISPHNLRLFWTGNYYAVFWIDSGVLSFLKVDGHGKGLSESVPVVKEVWSAELVQSPNSFGISWVSAEDKQLYFTKFDPAYSAEYHPIRVGPVCPEDPLCREKSYSYSPQSVFWTGKAFGLCWNSPDHVIMLGIIPDDESENLETHELLKIRQICYHWNSPPDTRQETLYEPRCAWNGSEIGLVAKKGFGDAVRDDLIFANFSMDGKTIREYEHLGDYPLGMKIRFPLSNLVWTSSNYLIWVGDHLFMVKP